MSDTFDITFVIDASSSSTLRSKSNLLICDHLLQVKRCIATTTMADSRLYKVGQQFTAEGGSVFVGYAMKHIM